MMEESGKVTLGSDRAGCGKHHVYWRLGWFLWCSQPTDWSL